MERSSVNKLQPLRLEVSFGITSVMKLRNVLCSAHCSVTHAYYVNVFLFFFCKTQYLLLRAIYRSQKRSEQMLP